MNAWTRYSEIKMLVEKYWDLKEDKRHEDFIKELCMILKI